MGPFAANGPPAHANEHTVCVGGSHQTPAAVWRCGGTLDEPHDSVSTRRAEAGGAAVLIHPKATSTLLQ